MGKTIDISNKIDDIVNTFNNGEMNIIANTANKLETPVNIAGVSFDAFIPPKPYNSWILNEETCLYNAPVEHPQDDKIYRWDEETTNWIEV